MNLANTIRYLLAYGTHEGVEKAWDTRGRGEREQKLLPERSSLAEDLAQRGKGLRKIIEGVAVYYPTFADSSQLGMHALAIIAGRNVLTYHDTSSGTKYHYRGQNYRTNSTDDAVRWAVDQHLRQQQARRPRPYESSMRFVGTLAKLLERQSA